MVEIKIRFKSGDTGYFTVEEQNVELIFNGLASGIKNKTSGTLEVMEIGCNKKTIINIQDISSFGFSIIEI